MPALGFFLLCLGAGGGERAQKKAACKEVMALLLQLVPSPTENIYLLLLLQSEKEKQDSILTVHSLR